MIAKKNSYLQDASETLYTLNADEMIRQQCQARDDYNVMERRMKIQFEKVVAEKEALASENETLTSENEILKKLLEKNGISYPAQIE